MNATQLAPVLEVLMELAAAVGEARAQDFAHEVALARMASSLGSILHVLRTSQTLPEAAARLAAPPGART